MVYTTLENKVLLTDSASIQLAILLLDVWIHECAVHGLLWNATAGRLSDSMTAVRLNSLYRCMNAVQVFLKTVLAIPDGTIHNLAFPSWSSWCYVCIMACKLVFLGDEREQRMEMTETFAEVLRVVLDPSLHKEPRSYSLPIYSTGTTWNPIVVAREADVLSIFQKMYIKLKVLLPENIDADKHDHCRVHPLSRIAYFQRSFLVSFVGRLDGFIRKADGSNKNHDSNSQSNAIILRDSWAAPQTPYTRERRERGSAQLIPHMHFNSINFDSIAPPENTMPPDVSFADWLWNTPMDDLSMPPPL